MTWILILTLFVLGLWGLVHNRNLIKKILAMNVLNAAGIILFIYMGSLSGESAPILVGEVVSIVDPIPQALMLTVIIVGVCVTAFALALVYRIYRLYGTVNIDVIEKKMNEERDEH